MTKQQLTRIFVATALVAAFATAQPAQAATDKRCPKYEKLLKQAKLPVRTFSYVMWRESRCQPRAIGWNYKKGKTHRDCTLAPAKVYRRCKAVRSYDSGLLQINSTWVSVTAAVCRSEWGDMTVLLDAKCNVAVARYLYDNGGLGHWGNSGHP